MLSAALYPSPSQVALTPFGPCNRRELRTRDPVFSLETSAANIGSNSSKATRFGLCPLSRFPTMATLPSLQLRGTAPGDHPVEIGDELYDSRYRVPHRLRNGTV